MLVRRRSPSRKGPHLPISPHISPYLPIPPHISRARRVGKAQAREQRGGAPRKAHAPVSSWFKTDSREQQRGGGAPRVAERLAYADGGAERLRRPLVLSQALPRDAKTPLRLHQRQRIWGDVGEMGRCGDMPSSATGRAPRAAATPRRERASPRTPPPRRRRRPGSSTRCLCAGYASIGAGLGYRAVKCLFRAPREVSRREATASTVRTVKYGRVRRSPCPLERWLGDTRTRTPLLARVAPLMQRTHGGGDSGVRASRRPRGQQGVRQRVRRQGAASVPQPAAPPPRRRPPN